MMKHNLNLKVRPEWQPAIVGWRRFVAARPDLHLTSGHNGLNWFIRNHRRKALQSGVMCNGMWLPVCQHKPEPLDLQITYKSGSSGE